MTYQQQQLQKLWNSKQLKQCEQVTKQAALRDEGTLVSYAEDFGHMHHLPPKAIFIPDTIKAIQGILDFANTAHLPLTIRGKGMSQGGQSLPIASGIVLSMEKLDRVLDLSKESIWVEANASWSLLIDQSLKKARIPKVIPYNCDLSVGGVLSAGGMGAQSFKMGAVIDNVLGLEVITANGSIQKLKPQDPLFHACLGGQGRFAVITKAEIALRPCLSKVRTFYLLYLDKDAWLADVKKYMQRADYLECFVSPAAQGAKITDAGRLPFAAWFYALHVSVEYEIDAPSLDHLAENPQYWKLLHSQDEPLKSYLHRHDGRFQFMKGTGLWGLQHLWYECFVCEKELFPNLENLLASLPLYYAQVLQIVPVRRKTESDFFMTPQEPLFYAVMILNPGLVPALVPFVLETMRRLDDLFLKQGGKRYLSGFLGENISPQYWAEHFGSKYGAWLSLKQDYDPNEIFCSLLHSGEE